MAIFFNFFSIQYFLIFSLVLAILSAQALGGLIIENSYGKGSPGMFSENTGWFGRTLAFFFFTITFYALFLGFGYLVTWVSKLEAGTSLSYGETWWYIARWTATGITLSVVVSHINATLNFSVEKDAEALLLRAERNKLIAEMLEITEGAIKKVNKIEESFLSNYKNKLNSYEKDYMNLINIIETEEAAIEGLMLDNPRIGDLISSREVGDSKKFLEKKEKIFSEINITNYKKIAKDRPFDESSIELLRAVDEYKEKLSDPKFPSLDIAIGVVKKGYEKVQEAALKIPKTYLEKKMLEDLLKKPIILSGTSDLDSVKELSKLIMDEDLLSELRDAFLDNPKDDVRDIIKKHMKRMGISHLNS